jgi:hypothetical protein
MKTLMQMDDELAREIIRALGFEFFDELGLVAPAPNVVAVAMLDSIRTGRREGDHPMYVTPEEFEEVKTLLAHHRTELAANLGHS